MPVPGQHPSFVLALGPSGVFVQLRAQPEPTIASAVHALPSSQLVGQLPSQVSPFSMTRLPQTGSQSLSFV
jgi:hypothetical protein